MRKYILSAILVLTTALAWSQTDVNFALASNGSTATASSGNADAAIDGNTNSRWESAQSDPQWLTVDMGQVRTFNSIRIIWEGAYGKTFTFSASNDGENYTQILSVSGQKLSGFPHTQVFAVPETSAQYVRFDGIARGTDYGYSFFELEIFQAAEPEIQSVSLSAESPICPLGESLALTCAALDQYGRALQVDPTYTITPADAGSVVNGVYTPAHTGLATIVATADGMSSEPLAVVAYGGGNLALNHLLAESGHSGNDDASKAVDGKAGTLWNAHAGIADASQREVDAWFTVDLGGFYNVDFISVSFEGARSEAYHIDASADNQHWDTIYTGGHSGVAAVVDYFYGNTDGTRNVRYLRFFSTKDASQYGMKVYEMEVYGSLIPDVEAPELYSAVLCDSAYSSLTFKLNYHDNLYVARCEAVDAANMKRATVAVEADSTITITGLVSNRRYNFALTAIDGSGNRSTENVVASGKTTVRYSLPQTAAPVPGVPAAQVIAIYSDAYTVNPVWTSYDAEWGDKTILQQKVINGDNYLLYTNLDWLGWTCATAVNASVMEKLHIDVWSEKAGSVNLTPIFGGEGLKTDDSHHVTLTLKAQRWNSFDIELSQFGNLDLSSIFQMKFDNSLGLAAMAVDNVYFYRTTPYEDVVPPTDVQLTVVKAGYHDIVLSVAGQDNGPSLTYTILNGLKKETTVSAAPGVSKQVTISNLKMGSTYTFSAYATDFSGLVSDTTTITVSTLAAPAPGSAPAPLQPAGCVRSLYSNHFRPFTYFWAGYWYQKTQMQDLIVAPGDTALLFTDFDYLGWEINNNVPMNMSQMSYLHIDVWAPTSCILTLLPISQGLADNAPGQVLDIVGDEWNSFDLLLDEFPTDFRKFLQMKFYDATGSTFVVDNVYFWGYPGSALQQNKDAAAASKHIEDGRVIITRGGIRYDITGRTIR